MPFIWLKIVANGLGFLLDRIVFVGGATMVFYGDDPASSSPRPTEDVNSVIEIAPPRESYAQ